MVEYISRDSSYRSIGKQGDEYSPDIAETLRSLMEISKVANKTMTGWLMHRKDLQGLRKRR